MLGETTRGIPLLALERNSREIDRARSKEVRSATLYQVTDNMFYFRVSGNSKPFYQVRIRFEDWDRVVNNPRTNTMMKAKQVVAGRISFDCQCGRHQYWYRYLACIGEFAVELPKEQAFPKIRNPGLSGCCCKHVLKVLKVLKGASVQLLLQKELEKSAKRTSFSKPNARLLKDVELKKVAKARGRAKNDEEAKDAYNTFLKNAREFLATSSQDENVKKKRSALKPKPKTTIEKDIAKLNRTLAKSTSSIDRDTRIEIIALIKAAHRRLKKHEVPYSGEKKKFDENNNIRNQEYNEITTEYKITREQLDTIIKEEKL